MDGRAGKDGLLSILRVHGTEFTDGFMRSKALEMPVGGSGLLASMHIVNGLLFHVSDIVYFPADVSTEYPKPA